MRRAWVRGTLGVVALAAMLASSALPCAAQGLPRVAILTMGGTIAGGPAGENYGAEDFLREVPQIRGVAEVVHVEEVARAGSSKITPSHWLSLAKRIDQLFGADPDLAGIVVTHGTDSLEETAFFLHLTTRDARPVVVVGAMRDWDKIAPDGPANLYAAVRVAAHPDAVGKGGLVVMNDEISSARDVRKTDALRLHTFRAMNQGFLGVVDEDAVLFYRDLLYSHTTKAEFDVSGLDRLPDVAMVADYTGSDGWAIREAAERGAAGIVVMGFPSGLLSTGSTEAALEVAQRGIPIVHTSRAPLGRVSDSYRLGRAGTPRPIAGRDHSPHKARILLMLALTRTRDFGEIQRIFDSY